jgi:hypothetical protein
MTLRLALVIDGDANGALAATQATVKGVDDLGKKVDGLNTKLGEVGKQRPAGTDVWGRTAADIEKARTASAGLAGNIKEVGTASGQAAPNIVAVGTAAGGIEQGAGKAVGALKNLAVGFGAGLGVGLFTAAMDLAIGKAIDFAQRIYSDAPRIRDDLKGHADLVRDIRDAYNEAKGAASSYGNNSKNLLTFQAQQDVTRLGRDLQDSAPPRPDALFPSGNTFSFSDPAGPFRDAVEQLKLARTEVIAFRDEVAKIAAALPADSPFRKLAQDALDATEAAAKVEEEYRRAQDLLKGVKGDADAAATALGGAADKYVDLGAAAGNAGGALTKAAGGIDATAEAASNANAELARYVALLNNLGSGSTIPTPSLPGVSQRPFAYGGYTGDYGTGTAVGVVHGREYVFDAGATARIGVGTLDAMRRGVKGYASGGFVGGGYFPSAPAAGGSVVANTASDFQLLRGSLHEFLSSLANGKDLLASLGGVISSVSQRFLDLAFKSLDNLLFTGSASGNGAGGLLGILGGLFGGGGGAGYFPPAPGVPGGLYHGGGIVGSASSFKRVAASVFAGAPRLHGGGVVGLSQGERPIIAMDGEEVGWPGQLAQKYGRGGGSTVVNNFNIQTESPRAFAQSKATVARASARFIGRIGRHA